MRILPVTYLASYLLSVLGNAIAAVALPLIVLQTTGSALGAGIVSAATVVPAVLAGLLMGVVIDRVNRRTSSVVTDLVSAAAVAALPLVDRWTGLSIGWFVLFGVIGSVGDVPGLTARDALLPAVVRHGGISAEQLTGIREAVGAVAILVGPGVAGTLMGLLDGATVLWVTAGTSCAAALLTLLVPRRVGAVVTGDGAVAVMSGAGWSQLCEGWRVLRRSGFLLATTAISVVSGVVLAALQGLVLPVYFTLVERPGMLGFVLSALAAGTLVGSIGYAVAGARGRRRVWFLAGVLGCTLGQVLIATLCSVPTVLAGAFVFGLAAGVLGSLVGVLMIERVPEEMRGRIMGTQNAAVTAAPAIGIMVAAVLAEYAGVRLAAVGVAAIWLVALLLALLAPSLRDLGSGHGLPTADEGTVAESAQR